MNMPEYARICLNMPKSAWMAFFFQFPISVFVLQSHFTWTRGYLFECLLETEGYEHEVGFLTRQILIFSIADGSISFVFLF